MTDAPERIWVKCEFTNDTVSEVGDWTDFCTPGSDEYIRADIAQARIAELEAVIEWYANQASLARPPLTPDTEKG